MNVGVVMQRLNTMDTNKQSQSLNQGIWAFLISLFNQAQYKDMGLFLYY